MNEPHISDDTSLQTLWTFCNCTRAYELIHQSPFQVPIIDGDGFRRLEDWKGIFPNNANSVVNHHIYYAFNINTNSNLASIQDDICEKIHSINMYYLPVLIVEFYLAVPFHVDDENWKTRFLDTQASV
jgi:hypothetical protein